MSDAFEKRIKKHVIGKPHRFLAVVPLGFEQTLIDELKYIGIETLDASSRHPEQGEAISSAIKPHIVGDGKVEFTAKITEAWKAVAHSRIANRVLMHIADFKAENFRELEKKASEIPWELYLDERTSEARLSSRTCSGTRDERYLSSNSELVTRNSINIHVSCKHSRLYHSDAIAERLQKIIGENDASYSQNLYVTLIDDRCTIWLDLAGEELYKRGHERFVNDAPLKETIAAAMLFEAIHLNSKQSTSLDPSASALRASAQDDRSKEIQDDKGAHIALFDPMAGSGTFSLEAAYIANKIIPGTCRDFALKHQPAFKEATWNYIIRRETSVESLFSNIITSDISERAIEIIKHNVECSPLASIEPAPISPQIRDFFSYTAKEIADASKDASPIIVLNPPYGKRLDFDAPRLYTKIGRKLTELARDLGVLGKKLTVAILAPKDDSREGSKYTCTSNLLRECPSLSPEHNAAAKQIITSHGGLTLNTFIAKI